MADPEFIRDQIRTIRAEVARCVIGMDDDITLLLCAILARRHVLLEGVPGLGKTHLLNTLAQVTACAFKRIQFTPDLLPADILGGYVYDPRDGSFELRRGPIFANIILADEINRAPAKTQSALLEVMQEHQVTIEGTTIPMTEPFFVFATQNPVDHEGTHPLPQAQLDRFALRIRPAYPTPDEERRILQLHRAPLPAPNVVLDPDAIIAAQHAARAITVADEVADTIIALCNHTRGAADVLLGGSPRLSLDLMHLCRALALLHGRDYVIPDDVKTLWHPAANHRIVLTTHAQIAGTTTDAILNDALHATHLV